ncbi:MAG: sel1 repeat family protein [Rhodomicrobium sp.]|nr:sel1 repeat family protein [Rhodomicrobium sp.]
MKARPLLKTIERQVMTSHAPSAIEAPAPILIQAGDEFVIGNMRGAPGRPLALNMRLPDFQPSDYVLLSFRGLPDDFSLSSGFRTAEAWLVSAHEAKTLWLIPSKTYEGTFDVEVQLIRGQNIAPLVQTARVQLSAESSVQPNAISNGQTTVGTVVKQPLSRNSAAETPPELTKSESRVDQQKETELMSLASRLLEQNDIAAARLIYARLAHQGSVQGALTMAETYDSSFLSKYDVMGLQPDVEQAKYWYNIAAKLGSEDASSRLLALEGGARQ